MNPRSRIFFTVLLLILLIVIDSACDWMLPYSTPPVPKDVKLTVDSDTKITIAWTAKSSLITSFVIERSVGFANNFGEVTTVTTDITKETHSYDDTSAVTATQYTYRIKALGSGTPPKKSDYSAIVQGITWAIVDADINPDPSQIPILTNPTYGRSYIINATTSSTTDSYKDKWTHDKTNVSTYSDFNGDTSISRIANGVFTDFNFGEFAIKTNASTSWTVFADGQLVNALATTAWFGGMADDIAVSQGWTDNWGKCNVVITDVTP